MNEMSGKVKFQDRTPLLSAVPSILYHLFRIILGAVFIVASIEKIARPEDFGRAIDAYKILVGPFQVFISPVAVIFPWLELVTGFFLIINRLVRPSALLILGMNIIFVFAIASAMVRGLEVECGCGLDIGFLAQIAGTQADANALIRDFILIAMNLVVLLAPQSRTGRK